MRYVPAWHSDALPHPTRLVLNSLRCLQLAQVSYPLRNQGVRMVTGRVVAHNGDDNVGGSNGAGKTALVMAPLWAMSGETDPRPAGSSSRGLSGPAVIHHEAREARVRLTGTVNNETFVVERVVGRRKRSLIFRLGEIDYTGQDLALTQAKIDEMLVPPDVLRDAVFHGMPPPKCIV
jgi:hypothetical protein